MVVTSDYATGSENAYAKAGVNIAAGDLAVQLMAAHVAKSRRPEVLGGIGGFAGLFDAAALKNYQHPILATSTDGVGTKVAIAQALDVHHTIGWDLVGMLVDDLVVCGAEPLFVTDYIACGKVVPERIAEIVRGISEACAAAGAALIGGETAEHPGLMRADEYDIAGATVGVVEQHKLLGAERVRPGDVVVALAASGLHSNGYSLVRRVFGDAGWEYGRYVADFGRTLGEELLTPTRVYALDVLALLEQVEVHALSHITGGGFAGNLVRVIPDGIRVEIDRATWSLPRVFSLVQEVGDVSRSDIESTLNLGIGMAAVLPAAAAEQAIRVLEARGVFAWICGEVLADAAQPASVQLIGAHAI
ncbi:MAG: phosphoribosylformylglycinamidine cyclo-ligase [Propionibacteriaceae bacterium]|jgi:phosphoribosylformylglycinamidine cyclo-ligase|nr:phosphoribosylformylglycinamidine cyclo-ligase [Propionibacteriaceae bacterium]